MDPNVNALSDLLSLWEYLVSLVTLIFQTYTASIVIIGAYIGVDRYLYLREKYTKWKARKKEELE